MKDKITMINELRNNVIPLKDKYQGINLEMTSL